MSSALGFLFLLVPAVAIAYIIWTYRKKSADKEAQSRERLATLVGISQNAATAGAAPREHAAAEARSRPPAAATPPPARRERFLTQSESLLYYVLKAGLPGHEVFPRVGVGSILEAPGQGYGQTLERGRDLALHDIDFVICDKSMRIVAAIRLEGGTASDGRERAYRRLNDAGIRLVALRPDALPRREQVHALVFG